MHASSRRTFGFCAALLCAFPIEARAQDDLAAIEVILGYSLVEPVLEGQAESFLLALSPLIGTEHETTGIERVVREEFAADRIRTYVVDAFLVGSLPEELAEGAELLRNGAIGRVSQLVAEYEPPETLEAFIQAMRATPPRADRVDLLSQFADAQQAASFYLLLDETLRKGAHRVASVVTEDDHSEYVELAPSARGEQLRRGRQFAVVSYLHRFRPVGDDLVTAATQDYLTHAGQWYVRIYSLALADAIQLAALRVAGRLSG